MPLSRRVTSTFSLPTGLAQIKCQTKSFFLVPIISLGFSPPSATHSHLNTHKSLLKVKMSLILCKVTLADGQLLFPPPGSRSSTSAGHKAGVKHPWCPQDSASQLPRAHSSANDLPHSCMRLQLLHTYSALSYSTLINEWTWRSIWGGGTLCIREGRLGGAVKLCCWASGIQ